MSRGSDAVFHVKQHPQGSEAAMDWIDIVKLALPAAVCAYFLGLRTATAFLLVMVTVMVFGLGLLSAAEGGHATLGEAVSKVAASGPPLFSQMIGIGAAGIVIGWWLRTWTKMVRASRMTREPRSPI
jgi:hypothetical protein